MATAGIIGALRRFWGRGVYPSALSFWLDFPLRRFILSPRELAGRLHLQDSFRVLEIGPGPGYFSVEVARGLSRGELVLLDLQRQMLQKARRKCAAAKLHNVSFLSGDGALLPFRDHSFDVVFLVAVLGEIPFPGRCLQEIYRVLQPSGILSITEQPGDPDFLSFPDLCNLAGEEHFEFVEKYGSGKNYTANFRKDLPDIGLK